MTTLIYIMTSIVCIVILICLYLIYKLREAHIWYNTDYIIAHSIVVKHKKTGNFYNMLFEAVECTNGREEIAYVVYKPVKSNGLYFVRERDEFYQKFEIVQEE